MEDELQLPIASDKDVVAARQAGRALGAELGFSKGDLALIATSISELARNILQYAQTGTVTVVAHRKPSRRGLTIIAEDAGPGISDVAQAMRDGFSTSGGLGLGLPGVRRLSDEFELHSRPGEGTRVLARKWVT